MEGGEQGERERPRQQLLQQVGARLVSGLGNLTSWSCLQSSRFWGWGRGPTTHILSQDGDPPPSSERRRGGENPARRSPGGRRKEATIHQKPLLSFEFLVLSPGSYFDQQELWSETIHCWLTAG